MEFVLITLWLVALIVMRAMRARRSRVRRRMEDYAIEIYEEIVASGRESSISPSFGVSLATSVGVPARMINEARIRYGDGRSGAYCIDAIECWIAHVNQDCPLCGAQ